MDFNQLILVAFLVESLIQTIKPIYDREKGWNKDGMIALFVGVVFCVLVKVNLFEIVNINLNIIDPVVTSYVGMVLTGVIASRGSNLAHDLLKVVSNSSSSSSGSAVG
jgi:hypothetical protein